MIDKLLDKLNLQALVTDFVQSSLAFLPNLLMALLIIVAAFLVSRGARGVARKAMVRAHFNEVLIDLLVGTILHYTIIVLGLVMALSQLGVNVAAALAGIGVVGIAVGFAAQDSVANVISGFLIFWDKPFEVGDWIETEGQYGEVKGITLRTTRIRTADNSYVVIPNKRIIDEVLENYSKEGPARINAIIGIAYKEDIGAAREALVAAMKSMDDVMADPAPDVVVDELAGSSVNLKMRAWVATGDRRRPVECKLLETGKIALDEAGIEIPFPHLQLFVDTVEDRVWQGAAELAGPGARTA